MNTCCGGVKKTPGMESTPVKRTTDSPTVGQDYAVLGTPAAQLGDIYSMYKGVNWLKYAVFGFTPCGVCGSSMPSHQLVGDMCDMCVPRPPKPAPTRSQILSALRIDYEEEPWKYGNELEELKAKTEAELRAIGAWADVESHLNRLAEAERADEAQRAAKQKERAEKAAIQEEKNREHKLRIAEMEEAARKEIAEERARVAAALAARQAMTKVAKNDQACKYFRNNGTAEPAEKGWEPGCAYHKIGKCPFVHPDEQGWDAAVAKRKAQGRPPRHPSGGHRSGGMTSGIGFRESNAGESWRR